MKKLALLSIAVVVICAMIGAGTFAYFTSTDSASATFTAGTLNMALSYNSASGSSDDVTATWVSPTNWAPGQKITGTIHFTNKGTIDAHHIYFKCQNISPDLKDNPNLMNKIIITSLKERFNNKTTDEQVADLASQVGDKKAPLTLAEFVGAADGWFGYYTFDNISGTDDDVIAAGNAGDYDLIFEFTFDPDADNAYQGATCGFDLVCMATQNSPTDGMVCLHQPAE